FHFLDVPGIQQEKLCQLHGGQCSMDLSLKPVSNELGYSPTVVHVGMGEKERLHFPGVEPPSLAIEGLHPFSALEQPAVHKVFLPVVEQEAGTGHRSNTPETRDLHDHQSFPKRRDSLRKAELKTPAPPDSIDEVS